MSRRKHMSIIGLDLADLGSNILSATHLAGKAVLSAFGAGAIAAPVEQLESPYLKDWARSTPQSTSGDVQAASAPTSALPQSSTSSQPQTATVSKPDFVIVVHADDKHDFLTAVSSASVTGGRRFDGNGYKSVVDVGKKFSFGFDAPQVVTVTQGGKVSGLVDVKQVLFCVSSGDNSTRVSGDDPLALLEGSQTMAESNNLNLNERERVDFERGGGGEEFEAADASWSEIVGASDYHGGFVPNVGVPLTNDAMIGMQHSGLLHLVHPLQRGEHGVAASSRKGRAHVVGVVQTRVSSNPYVQGTHVLASKQLQHTAPGATSHAGIQIKTTPKGRKFTSLVLNRNAKFNPEKTVVVAKAVAQRGQQIANTALKAVANGAKKAAASPKAHVLGAGPSAGVVALAQEAKKLADRAKKLGTTADKYDKTVKAMPAKAATSAAKAKSVTKIHGLEYEVLGAECEIIGSECDAMADDMTVDLLGQMGPPVPDPTNPGFLTDGSPDPAYGGAGAYGGGAVAPGAPVAPGAMPGPTAGTSVPGPPDYGAGAVPTLQSVAPIAGQDFMPDPNPSGDDETYYDCPTDDDLPLGAVVFDGSHLPPFQGLGNYTVFFGQLPGSGPPKGGPYSGYSLHKPGDGSDSGWWLELMGTQPSFNYNGNHNFDHIDQFGTWIVEESKKNNWGPLMGNPNGGWTKGLRFSPSGPNGPRWFWFFDMAPSWATSAILQKRLNDAIVQYQAAVTAGQTDYVNAQLQDKLNAQQAAQQAQAQAAQDAQLAMQQQQLDAQTAASQAAQEQQAGQIMLQEQQQADQQAAAQAAMQQQQMQAQAAIQQQAMQAQLQYFQQHPEAMFTPVDQQQSAPQGGGVDWGDAGGGGDEDQLLQQAAASGEPDANELMQDE